MQTLEKKVWALLTVFRRRDAGLDALFGESLAESIAVIALVASERFCARQMRQHERRPFVIAHLARRQKQDQRLAILISDGVQL